MPIKSIENSYWPEILKLKSEAYYLVESETLK